MGFRNPSIRRKRGVRIRNGRRMASVAIDSGSVLLVDPTHLDYETLDWLLQPRSEMGGDSYAVTLNTPGGDGVLDVVSGMDNSTAVLVYTYDTKGDFTDATPQHRVVNLTQWINAEAADDAQ
jgi:hypothetical protein